MMCYKDRTFCDNQDCNNFGEKCFRSYTEEVEKAAQEWWDKTGKRPPPVCFFVGRPECWEERG